MNHGIKRGQKDFGIVAKTILCSIETYEKYNNELLHLGINILFNIKEINFKFI